MKYRVKTSDGLVGPLDIETIRGMIAEGKITNNTDVYDEYNCLIAVSDIVLGNSHSDDIFQKVTVDVVEKWKKDAMQNEKAANTQSVETNTYGMDFGFGCGFIVLILGFVVLLIPIIGWVAGPILIIVGLIGMFSKTKK